MTMTGKQALVRKRSNLKERPRRLSTCGYLAVAGVLGGRKIDKGTVQRGTMLKSVQCENQLSNCAQMVVAAFNAHAVSLVQSPQQWNFLTSSLAFQRASHFNSFQDSQTVCHIYRNKLCAKLYAICKYIITHKFWNHDSHTLLPSI